MKTLIEKNGIKAVIILLSLTLMFSSCDELFDFSPYEVRVEESYKNTTLKNLLKLPNPADPDSIQFAVIADSHYHYGPLSEAVKHLNYNYNIAFVLCAGDITDQGLLVEFELFHEAMSGLEHPWFTVIGNHDYRSNGEHVYKEMFGNYNYSFSYGFLKINVWDDVFWESNKEPDFDWLSAELSSDPEKVQVVLAHISPYADQFDEESKEKYLTTLGANEVGISLHGHQHGYDNFHERGINFNLTTSTDKGSYTIVTVRKDGSVRFENQKF